MVHNFGETIAMNQYITNEDLNRYNHFLNEIQTNLQQLDDQVKKVEHFYQSIDVLLNDFKNKGWDKPPTGSKKPLRRVSSREAPSSEEMQDEVMRHFSKILTEITQHENAWPFLEPVDVEGLELHDYYEIIKKPMDFSTIKGKMEAKDGSGYKNVREIYADVRLIFKNAMTYNDEKNVVHMMAKNLLERFEKKWLHLLPKVVRAEIELSKEETQEQLNKKLAQEATYAHKTRELGTELSKVDEFLKNLKGTVVSQCRKVSSPEKLILVKALRKLSHDNLHEALNIVHENNPNFESSIELVNLDIDSQSNYTLWRLIMFVKNALEVQGATGGVSHEDNIEDKKNNAKRRKLV